MNGISKQLNLLKTKQWKDLDVKFDFVRRQFNWIIGMFNGNIMVFKKCHMILDQKP